MYDANNINTVGVKTIAKCNTLTFKVSKLKFGNILKAAYTDAAGKNTSAKFGLIKTDKAISILFNERQPK